MGQLKIHPLPFLKINTPKGINTYMVDMTEIILNYSYSWYIEGSNERILVDVGCPVEAMIQRGHSAETVGSPVEALKAMDTSPEEIDLVICTHLHFDHIGYGHLYKNARFIVQKEEIRTAYDPHPIQSLNYRDKTLFEGLNFEIIEGDKQIVEGIKVIFTPGHTQGTQSVMVDTEEGKAVIAGMCSIRENFEPPESLKEYMPVITTGIHIDARQSFDSLLRVKNEADIIIPCHDPEFALRDTIP